MSREWKPGDVALVRGKVCIRAHGKWEHGLPDRFAFDDDDRARPLVVIDPENREQVERLMRAARNNDTVGVESMQSALRSLITPPKPGEPKHIGAVVLDEDGEEWTLARPFANNKWINSRTADYATYPQIAAVRVLSEGVQP